MANEPTTIELTRQRIAAGDSSISDVVEGHLKTITEWEPNVHGFTQMFADEAMQKANDMDTAKPDLPLAGIPIAIKDNICTVQGKTTAASNILSTFTAPYNATVIQRLEAAGAIIVGKTNLDEFAMGSSTEYSAQGVTKNPWDTRRVVGGSSGGSAAAVAYGGALAALGTDTGGSIRQPASFSNVVGVKPTYGRVSRFGAIAYGSSLDQIGPFGRTVKDAALILEVMAGQDGYDATTSHVPVGKYVAACTDKHIGMRVGVPKEFLSEDIDPEVKKVITQAIEDMKNLGATIHEISLPLTSAGIAVYYLLAKAEASSNLARYDGLRYAPQETSATSLIEQYMDTRGQGFGPEVKRAILMGTYALSAGYYDAWYKQASKVRTLIKQEYEAAFKEVDIIAAPVSPEPAFTIGAKTNDPLAMYLADALTVPVSVACLPAISVPAGFTKHTLPVGLQIIAPAFEEERMFAAAHAYEQSHDWWKATPTLS